MAFRGISTLGSVCSLAAADCQFINPSQLLQGTVYPYPSVGGVPMQRGCVTGSGFCGLTLEMGYTCRILQCR